MDSTFEKEIRTLAKIGNEDMLAKIVDEHIKKLKKTGAIEVIYYSDVSGWKRMGKQKGYWDYFEDRVFSKTDVMLVKLLKPNPTHEEFPIPSTYALEKRIREGWNYGVDAARAGLLKI